MLQWVPSKDDIVVEDLWMMSSIPQGLPHLTVISYIFYYRSGYMSQDWLSYFKASYEDTCITWTYYDCGQSLLDSHKNEFSQESINNQ